MQRSEHSTLYVKHPEAAPQGNHPPACITVRRLVHSDKWKGWDDDDDGGGGDEQGFYSGREDGRRAARSALPQPMIGWHLFEYEQVALTHTSLPNKPPRDKQGHGKTELGCRSLL